MTRTRIRGRGPYIHILIITVSSCYEPVLPVQGPLRLPPDSRNCSLAAVQHGRKGFEHWHRVGRSQWHHVTTKSPTYSLSHTPSCVRCFGAGLVALSQLTLGKALGPSTLYGVWAQRVNTHIKGTEISPDTVNRASRLISLTFATVTKKSRPRL